MLLNERELTAMRQQVIDEFDFWAPQLQTGEINGLQIDVKGYRKEEERVRSQGQRDPQRAVKLTRMK